jgi:hypothetical protein
MQDADGVTYPGMVSLAESPDGNTLLGIAKDPAAPGQPLSRILVSIDPLTGLVTRLGQFNVQMADLAFVYPVATAAASVTEVYVRGTDLAATAAVEWGPDFTGYLAAQGMGAANLGYRLMGPGRTPPTQNPQDILPWTNANQIVVRFNTAPTGSGIPTAGTVTVRGDKSGAYTVTAVNALDAQTFVLTLNKPLGGGNGAGTAPTAAENGEHVTITMPGAGPAGGNFSLRINVLQGDTDHSGETGGIHSVLAADYSSVKKKFFASTASPGTGDAAYSVFHDVNADAIILADDFSNVKKRFFQDLQPAAAAARSVALASITRDLFSPKRILA